MNLESLFTLTGRVALVTGGSRGIGKMIVKGLLGQGAKRVYITSRKAAQCDAAAAELSALGDCVSIPGDVSTMAGIRALAAEIAKREPVLDILVNNAGAAWAAPFDEFPESGWNKTVDLNMKTPFFLTQALAPQLRAAAKVRPAKVINVSSIDGISVNMWDTFAYSASKAGILHLTKRMALELIRDNVVVSGIAPGPFGSEMNVDARDNAEQVARRVPAGRVGRDEDMAAAAIYLASRAGDFVVGETIVVDGGVTLARG